MRHLFSAILFAVCVVSGPFQVAAEGDDKCATSNSYKCPYLTDICNETVYVGDCLSCDNYMSTDSANNVCFDRKLLNGKDNPNPSYLWRDILGLIVWFVTAGVATACGVGGGGVYVPLGILLLGFAPKPSSGLSQASIFGASLGGLILNLRNRHPWTTKVTEDGSRRTSVPTVDHLPANNDNVKYYTRPLIDFDMALFLAPMEMAGAVLGVLIQKILPNWLYLTLAAIILAFTAYKTYGKFLDTRGKEIADRQAEEEGAETKPRESTLIVEDGVLKAPEITNDLMAEFREEGEGQGDITDQSVKGKSPSGDATVDDVEDEDTSEGAQAAQSSEMTEDEKLERRKYWLERDARQFPGDKLFGLTVLWMGLIILTFMKGGKGVESIVGITCASPWYGVLIAIQFAWTMGISALYGYLIMKSTKDKMACDYPWHPTDVMWDFQKVRFYSFYTFLAGIVAGLIGVGGGMVLGPLMLIMGINPRVSSATTATMVVLTSSSVAVLFVTSGLVPWEYAVTFFSACFVGAYVGKTKIDGYVKRTGKASLLILLLAIIIALATLGCVVIVLTRLAAADWCFAGFNKFCTVSEDDSEGDMCPVDRMLFGIQS